VTLAFAIRRLLAVLTIAGLALAPVSRPVMALTSSDASQQARAGEMSPSEMSSSAVMDEMAGDMPCCPSKAPVPVDCDKCIYMAACASKCFGGTIVNVFHPLLLASDEVLPLSNESLPDGLGHPPPEHPPRTLV
jgi:hypothetical protein